VLPPPKTPGTHYFWTYPLRPLWDKRIRTSRN
jgi:hypothetical protein